LKIKGEMAERSIVDIGKFLQRYGLNIGENPAFGGVGPGHAPMGYHPIGAAIDVRDWRPDVAPAYEGGKPISWKQRTGELSWRAKQLGLFNEALGPGDPGHDTHVHLALEGKKYITDPQLEWLATGRYKTPEGTLTDVMPVSTVQNVTTEQKVDKKDSKRFQSLLNESLRMGLTSHLFSPAQSQNPLSLLQSMPGLMPQTILRNPLV